MRLLLTRLFVVLLISVPSLGTEEAVFNRGLEFQDENGQTVSMKNYLGKLVVLTMSYTECKKTCPLVTMASLRSLEKTYAQHGKKAEIVVVSFDPENDTPDVLKHFKEAQKIKTDNWHFLSGSTANTRSLATDLGLGNYWKMDDHVLHGFKIALFSEAGKLVQTLDWDHQELETWPF